MEYYQQQPPEQPQQGQLHREEEEEEQQEICPRCQSTRTKFCYYNNYSTDQPRFYCKTCKRYWTKGGTLRNVPIGGGSRKPRRPRRRSTTSDNPSPSTSAPVSAPPPPPPPPVSQGNENGADPAVFPAFSPPAVYYNTGVGVGVGLGGGELLPAFSFLHQPLNPGIGGFRSFQALGSFSNPSLHGFHFQLSHQQYQQQQYQPQQYQPQNLLAMEESLLLQANGSARPAMASSSAAASQLGWDRRRALIPDTTTVADDVGFWNSNVSGSAGGRSGQWPPSSSASFM